ncbi:MAG TPA: cytochrome c biogenesis protein CcsA [Bacteroidia bacterium]|nr:cytochrome c biogenesis protein CcsA [Bacteroidia bacterium]
MGHLFVVIAFITALFSVVANLMRVRVGESPAADGWKLTARSLYYAHAFAVIGIFVTLLLMLINHRFEYQYVWQHSKRDMSMNYILASLWEGQEGSTLLWLLWHSLIGILLTRRAKTWEAPVVGVLSLAQVFLSMMLLGLYVSDLHIGSSPFDLVRMREENIGLPWTQLPDYLEKVSMLKDGRGLNPLLQNYWMTIHPPTLFLGFALVTVPFAFAIGGLWTKRYHDWQRPALPWAYTGIAVLGTGVLMGGAWAYESLSFGGFWAWDPVENASLVPWMVLVGAAHVMLIYRIKGQSLFTTFFLTISAFLLIVYSTFLTKSGILSDTSVHAFTEDGLNQELTLFMGFFLWLSTVLLSFNRVVQLVYTFTAIIVLFLFLSGYHGGSMLLLLVASVLSLAIGYFRFFPKEEKEEELWSREFWMFIGALFLLVAAFQIIFWTSAPVVNKFLAVDIINAPVKWLADATGSDALKAAAAGKITPGEDVIFFYNKWQIGFAFVIAFLMAVTQFFRYRKTDLREFIRQVSLPFFGALAAALILSVIIYYNNGWSDLPNKKRSIYLLCSLLLFGVFFSIFANGKYWLKVLKGKISKAGASIAHLGFGLLLLGAIISTSKKDTISRNTSNVNLQQIVSEGDNENNIYLRKGDTLPMGKYFVTYTHRERRIKDGTPYVYFNVDFIDPRKNKEAKVFTLQPFIQINPFMGNAAEPDTRHYLHKDIYTFIKFVPVSSLADSAEASAVDGNMYAKPVNNTLARGDTIAFDNCLAVLDSIRKIDSTHAFFNAAETGLAAYFTLIDGRLIRRTLAAYYFVNMSTGMTRQTDGINEELGVKLTFWKVRPESGKIDVYSTSKLSSKADFIVMEASIFPGINILWLGCLVMIFGTVIAIRERVRKQQVTPG